MSLVLSTYGKREPYALTTPTDSDLVLNHFTSPGPESLKQLLARRWWLVIAGGIAGVVVASTYIGRIPDTYTAYGILSVQPQRFTIPELQGAVTGDHAADPLPEVLTEVQVLTSPRLVQQVIDQLHIDLRSADDSPADQGPAVGGPLAALQSAIAQLESWRGLFLESVGLETLAGSKRPALEKPTPDAIRQTILNDVQKRLAVSHDSRSLIINIQYTSTQPKMAADIVNTLIDVYDGARENDSRRINEAANKSLMGRIDDLHTQISATEEKIRGLRMQDDLPELTVGNVNEQQLSETITAANRTSVELAQSEAIAARARALAQTGNTSDLAAVVTSPTISRMRDQETNATRNLAELESKFGPRHPLVLTALSNLRALRGQISAEINRTVASIAAQAATAAQQDQKMQGAVAAARATSHRVAGGLLQIKQLEQDVAARRRLYEALLIRAEQTQFDSTQQMVTGARVISRATVPGLPVGPKRTLSVALGAVGGFLMGGFMALITGQSHRRFRDRDSLAAAVGMPVLSKLPPLASTLSPKAVEALRVLRSRISRPLADYKLLTVMFTAAGGQADVVATSVSFGRTAAMDGQRVLLVGGLLTQSQVARSLGVEMMNYSDGINGAFTTTTPLSEAVTRDKRSTMDFLLIGEPAPEFLNYLYASGFQRLLEQAKLKYDLVILCAPPPDSSETIRLAGCADIVLFIVGRAKVETVSLQTAIQDFPYRRQSYAAAVLTM